MLQALRTERPADNQPPRPKPEGVGTPAQRSVPGSSSTRQKVTSKQVSVQECEAIEWEGMPGRTFDHGALLLTTDRIHVNVFQTPQCGVRFESGGRTNSRGKGLLAGERALVVPYGAARGMPVARRGSWALPRRVMPMEGRGRDSNGGGWTGATRSRGG